MVEFPPKLKVFQNNLFTFQAPPVNANCSGNLEGSAATSTASSAKIADAV